MKHKSHSELAFFNRRFLISLFFSSLSVSFGLVALGAISANTGTKQPTRAPQTLRTKAAVQSQSSNALGHNRNRYLDDKGNRAVGFKSANPLGVKHPRKRPMGTSAWTSLGPPGGDVFDVAASTLDSNIVLAGIAPGGSFGGTLYRSTDGGDTWSEVTALDGTSVFDIEFAPDGTTYIATQDSVRKSTDSGISWATLNLGIGANDQVFDLTIDPSNSSNLWIGVADAAGSQPVNTMRSTDGGATWIDRTPPHAPMSGRGVAVDPNDSNTVIAVFGGDFGGGEAWVTTDGGDSWADRSTGLPGNPLNAVVYDGTRLLVGGGLLFGSQFVGLYQSPDLGVTWTALHDGTWPILVVEDIAVDPDDSDRIFVAIDGGGVNRTTDGGASWQIGVGNTQALAGRSIRFQPGNSQELFLGTSSLAVFRSTNGGDTFVQSSEGISELDLFSIDANPLDPNELAVAFQGQNNGGLLSSADGGTSWQLESAPPTRYSAVRFAPDGTLYAISTGPSTVAQEGLYRREDNGTWTPLGPDQGSLYESDLNTMRFSLNDPNLILLGGEDFGVAGFEGTIWRSTDAGDSWTKVYEVGDFHRITDIEIIEDGSDQNMVAVWNSESGDNIGGALRSTDNGASWFDSSSGLPGFFRGPRLCASPSDPQSLVVAASISFASGELFRTTDSGASWASTGFTATQTLGDVACHPVDDQVLFITQLSGGDAVLRSQDGGASFEPFANGLENVVAPRELAFAGNSRLLLASAKGSYGTELTTGTPTPTPSVTPSSTPTPTVTPSSTPTPSVTPTPIITPTPTTTPRATPRPRPTPHPRPTPPG